jgi:hypothetical protein
VSEYGKASKIKDKGGGSVEDRQGNLVAYGEAAQPFQVPKDSEILRGRRAGPPHSPARQLNIPLKDLARVRRSRAERSREA